MRSYAKVSPMFWIGNTGKYIRSLGRDAQVIALYLVTCPSSNMLGLYYLPIPVLCHEVGISYEGAMEALHSLSEGDFSHYDEVSEHVWVVEMARYQVGEDLKPKDNQIKGLAVELKKYQSIRFYNDFLDKYRDVYHLHDMPPGKPLQSPFIAPTKPGTGTGERTGETYYDISLQDISLSKTEKIVLDDNAQEPITENAAPNDGNGKYPPCPQQEIVNLYHETLPELPQVRQWPESRQVILRTRWKEDPIRQNLAWWKQFFRYVHESDFLMGRTKETFVPDLEWLIRPNNFTKIANGRYHNTRASPAQKKHQGIAEWLAERRDNNAHAETG